LSEAAVSDRYNIRVVDKAVRVLNMLSDGKPRTLTVLSKEMGINSSTTFRLLASLRSHHLVELEKSTGEYRLGIACLELSRAYQMENEVRRAALPEMEKLRDETRETVHLGILAEDEIVYLEKLEGLHAIGMMSSRVGGRAPSHCTGLGKVLLAFTEPGGANAWNDQINLTRYTDTTITEPNRFAEHLGQIRANGYALDKGEHEPEVRCVAAPVFGQDGSTVAAISVSGPSGRIDPIEENLDLIKKTRKTALQISKKLGYREEYFGLIKGELDAKDH